MLLILFCGVLLFWLLTQWVYRKYWERGLSVNLTFTDRILFEGETSSIRETVINDKLLPLPALEVRFSASRDLVFLKEARENSASTDQCYRRDIFAFLFHQRIGRTLPFSAEKRGIYEIREVSVTGHDFFFRSAYYTDFPQKTSLCVFPRQVDTRRIIPLYRAISGTLLSKNRLYPDPFAFSGIRDYHREDPMRQINWKASARTGSLMVNQSDSTTSISLTLIFDLEDSNILKQEELLEETIRLISSVSARLVMDRMPFSIVSNAADREGNACFPVNIPAEAGNIEAFNRRLSCIDTGKTVIPAEELLRTEAAAKKTGHTYLFFSKNHTPDLLAALRALTGANNDILWVLPVYPADAARFQTELPETSLLHTARADHCVSPGIRILPWLAQ